MLRFRIPASASCLQRSRLALLEYCRDRQVHTWGMWPVSVNVSAVITICVCIQTPAICRCFQAANYSTEASGSSTGAVIEHETLARELPDIAGVRPLPGSLHLFGSVDGCAKCCCHVHCSQWQRGRQEVLTTSARRSLNSERVALSQPGWCATSTCTRDCSKMSSALPEQHGT